MSYYLDYGYISFNKYGEELCGDSVAIIQKDNYLTLVLADGMGSGVKANILSTLTSKILSTMVSNNIDIEDCIETIVETLPICKERNIAYSTFSLIHLNKEGKGYIFEFDNPKCIFLRKNKALELKMQEYNIKERKIYYADLILEKDDVLIIMSDGVPYAGTGITLNYGWQRGNIIDFLENKIDYDMSARCIASLIGSVCDHLYMQKPYDDTSIAVIKIRAHTTANVLIGPPINIEDTNRYINDFLHNEGYKIVCGGSTSQIVAAYLKKDLIVKTNDINKEVPPIAKIEGIDLVTEGLITLRRLIELSIEYLKIDSPNIKMFNNDDGASQLANYLFEKASKINIYVGQAINEAYKDMPVETNLKFKLVEKLIENLRLMNKEINVNYY